MNPNGYIGRKMRIPALREKPAVVIAAFGSSRRARGVLEIFNKRFTEEFADYELFWAWTSEIIRKKMGLPGLQETLAEVEAAGFRKAVVQPLHIFPGTEYRQMEETCGYFPGLRVFLSESLLHRWPFVKEILQVMEHEFLGPDEGLNLLALHGTPLASDPVNTIYLGLERMVADLYPNVIAASVEGVPDHEAVFAAMRRRNLAGRYARIKIIPMMFLAGLHAEEDLMGEGESWRSCLEDMGFSVECPMVEHEGHEYFKGLAWYPEVASFFMERLRRSLELVRYY